ncbi:MAG: MATE family efflux transporter, partial [Alistipes sp.]|nr:MATE family efflux transporter [Alistipes sp.]
HTRMLTANSILMLSVNVVFNYVLIFGKCGFPAMGIAGAAIASALAEMVSALYFVIYSVWVIDHRRYALFRRCRLHLSLLGRILKTSIWTMIQSCVSVTSWFLFFVAVEHLGEHSLAITNIVRSISGILFMGISAYASTASTLTGNLIGARNLRSVLPTAWRVIRMSYTIVLPVVVVFALFPELLLRIYTDDPSLIADTLPSLWVMLSSYVVTIPANILFSTVSGTGNTRSALWLELQALGFYILYVAYVVEWLRADVAICWSAEWVYNGLLGVVCYRYLMRSKWFTKRI